MAVSRRVVLKGLAGGGAILAGSLWAARSPRVRGFVRGDSPEYLDRRSPTGTLSEGELTTVIALAEVLLPADESPGATADWVRSHVDARTNRAPGFLAAYREAAQLLDAWSVVGGGTAFAALAPAAREAVLLRELGPEGPDSHGTAQLGLRSAQTVSKARVWQHVVQDLIVAFFRSPAGWAVVGYTNFPGVPGEPLAYTVPPRGTAR